MALAARRPPGLLAVINFAGGLRHKGSCTYEPALISTFAGFGARSGVPTLWLYAQNDSLFGPSLVTMMHQAYVQAGSRRLRRRWVCR